MYLKLSFVSVGLLIPLCTSRSTALDKKDTCAWQCVSDYKSCALMSVQENRNSCDAALALCCHHSTTTELDKGAAQFPVGNVANGNDDDDDDNDPIFCRPGDADIPNSIDSGSFYSCQNGVPVLIDCPAGMVFNPDIKVCDYPGGYDCTPTCSSALCHHHSTTTESDKGAAQFPVDNVDDGDDGDDGDGDNDPSGPPVCRPGDTYLPNPDNRGSFYQCQNGVPVFIPCPANMVYNPDIKTCDYP